jgi:hypothetical protein
MIPVIQPRVDIRKTLMDKELGSKLTYFETLQLLVEQQEELSVQKSHLNCCLEIIDVFVAELELPPATPGR